MLLYVILTPAGACRLLPDRSHDALVTDNLLASMKQHMSGLHNLPYAVFRMLVGIVDLPRHMSKRRALMSPPQSLVSDGNGGDDWWGSQQ